MTEHEWLASEDPAAMLQLMTGSDMGSVRPSDRKLRLFACSCVRQIWHLLGDERSRIAVEVAERFADGGATGDELVAASAAARAATSDTARAAASDAASDAAWAAWTARAAARAAASDAARDAVWDAVWYVVWDAASAVAWTAWTASDTARAARNAARDAARDAASRRQASLLRDIVGDPFRSVTLPSGPTCITPQVLSLAQAAYDERLDDGTLDPFRLALLADAMEEAGCPSFVHHLFPHLGEPLGSPHPLLAHLRSPGRHYRGCWAVDLILGRG